VHLLQASATFIARIAHLDSALESWCQQLYSAVSRASCGYVCRKLQFITTHCAIGETTTRWVIVGSALDAML
jgi:hypothetical protein